MAYFRTLLLLVVSAEAARVAPVQKKLEKAENTTKPAKVDEKTLEKEKALEKKDETLKMCMSKMFDMLQHPDQQKNAAKCEKDGKFVDQVIGDIQKDDEAAAKAQVNQLFTKCASLPTDCAAEVAPQLIEMLRLSGAAVSKKCRDEIQKPQEDEKLMTEASNCDSKMNISESTLSALNAGNLTKAQGFSEQALTQCMHVSKDCAHQAAPAFLNTAMMHVMEERAMEEMLNSAPVMVIQPIIMVTPDQIAPAKGQHKKALSLLSMAASTHKKQFRRAHVRGSKTTALLQVGSHQGPWISELLVKLAVAK
jgi:hypothetical protein